MTLRYGVQFQPDSGIIEAGPVRKAGDREVFILKSDVTRQVVGAAALYLLYTSGSEPFRISDRHGNTYELSAKVVTT